MRIYFSADQHFGGKALVDLGVRSKGFKSVEDMNEKIIRGWNERVSPFDLTYNLGDFISYGRDHGIEGSREKPEAYETRLNGKVVHIRGNHDAGNGLRGCLTSGWLEAGGYQILLVHNPVDAEDILEGDRKDRHLILCGHVHTAWSERFMDFGHGKILAINVGVDVRKFRPIRLDEVICIADRNYRHLDRGKEDEI